MSIYKAYDIRGVYPDELDEEKALKIGKSLSVVFTDKDIVVGYDRRLSGPALFQALSRGLTDCGKNIVFIGAVSTPVLYFAVAHGGYGGGVMITASHNPKEYNGFKLCERDAVPVYDQQIQKIQKIVDKESWRCGAGKGEIRELDIIPEYTKFIHKFAKDMNRYKVVIDTGNAVCGEIIERTYRGLPIDIIPLYFEPDGNFPNHEPDPLKPKNLEALRKCVLENHAALGAAFDGDGDRVFFVDEKGAIIAGDMITLLVALDLLDETADTVKPVFLYDCRSTWALRDILEPKGAYLIQSRVGHAFIKNGMRKHNAIFAGELSGHFYYRDSYFTENSDITLFRILRLMTKTGKPLSQVVAPYKIYVQSGEINSKVRDKDLMLQNLEKIYEEAKISHIDGLTVEFDDFWFNVRPSNTEPLLRLNLEAKSEAVMEKERDRLLAIIREQ